MKLVAARWVHVTVCMPLFDIGCIQRVVFLGKRGADIFDGKVRVALQYSFLLAVEFDTSGRDTGRYACRAALAVGTVQVVTAATKSHFGEFGINLYIHGLARVEKQRGGLFVRQITARMWLGGVELETSQ
jgi:hypothetical protein